MKNRKLFMLVVITILFQRIIISNIYLEYYSYPFLNGVPITNNIIIHNLYLIQWFFPLYFVMIYFSGSIDNLLYGYGKLLILRRNSKIKIFLMLLFKNYFIMLLFLLIHCIIFSLGNSNYKLLSLKQILMMFFIYYMTLITLVSMQMFTEFYMIPQVSNLLISIYILMSILIENQLLLMGRVTFFNYILIPNFAMGFRNGVISSVSKNINYTCDLIILVSLNFLITIFSIVKLRKKDLF